MASIHPSAVVDKDAHLSDDVVIGPHCVVEAEARLGAGTRLIAHAVVGAGAVLGEGNVLYPNCVIGSMPQILGWDESVVYGGLVIGDNNTFRENVTIHCSMYPGKLTRIGNDNLLMVGAHIGHDSDMDDHIVLSNGCQISGHCRIETGVWMSGLAGLHQFVTIHKWSYAAAMTAVTRDVPPFVVVSGNYPTRVRGVNLRGVRRAGLDEVVEKHISAAFKRLYRQGGTLLENARLLGKEEGLDENVQFMIEAIERTNQHRFGRYLETFR